MELCIPNGILLDNIENVFASEALKHYKVHAGTIYKDKISDRIRVGSGYQENSATVESNKSKM